MHLQTVKAYLRSSTGGALLTIFAAQQPTGVFLLSSPGYVLLSVAFIVIAYIASQSAKASGEESRAALQERAAAERRLADLQQTLESKLDELDRYRRF